MAQTRLLQIREKLEIQFSQVAVAEIAELQLEDTQAGRVELRARQVLQEQDGVHEAARLGLARLLAFPQLLLVEQVEGSVLQGRKIDEGEVGEAAHLADGPQDDLAGGRVHSGELEALHEGGVADELDSLAVGHVVPEVEVIDLEHGEKELQFLRGHIVGGGEGVVAASAPAQRLLNLSTLGKS